MLDVHFICISRALESEMRSFMPRKGRIHVAHDAHPFQIPGDIQVGPSCNERIRVGYFGSLTKQKGLGLLQILIREAEGVDFYIYAKEPLKLEPSPSLISYCHLPHSEVYRRMQEMDILLLLVVPQEDNDRISKYTSPLKLYEYLASGRPIIASDIEVLREDVSEDFVTFSKNDPKKIIRAIDQVRNNREKYRDMARRGLLFAEERTYKNRAKAILTLSGIMK